MTRLGRALSPGRLERVKRGRGPARWVLDYRDAQGRRHRQQLGTDRRVAERRMVEIIRQRDLEEAGLGAVEGQSRSLLELRDLYLADLRARTSPKHAVNVEDQLDRMLADLRVERVRDVRPIDVMRVRQGIQTEGKANRTVNLHTNALRAMQRWAVDAGLIAENPIARLKPLPDGVKHQVRRRRALSEDEIERFLAAAAEDDRACEAQQSSARSSRVRGRQAAQDAITPRVPQLPLWRAFVETGARYGELTTTTWGDVDLERRVLTLRAERTKAGQARQIPLLDGLVGELRALMPVHERLLSRRPGAGDRVFLSPEGAAWPVHTVNLMRIFDRVLAAAGIEREDALGQRLDIHALRHTAASRLARAGVGLVHAQRILGHSDPKLTARAYTHLGVEELRAAVERLPGARVAS